MNSATKIDNLLKEFETMTLGEVAQFIPAFEERFNVKAATPTVPVLVQPQEELPELDEQTEFNVTLIAHGPKKIEVIKVVREITKQTLVEAKSAVDNPPFHVVESVSLDKANEIKERLESIGAQIEVT